MTIIIDNTLEADKQRIEAAIKETEHNAGAICDKKVVDSLARILDADKKTYYNYRERIKKLGIIPIADLEKYIRQASESENPTPSMTEQLVEFVTSSAELFHNEQKEPFATFENNGHKETWGLYSNGFSQWLSHTHYKRTSTVPRENCIKDAINTLAGKAKFEGQKRSVYIRCGKHHDVYYIDLCNNEWQIIEIKAGQWNVINDPPIRFIRSSSMLALPQPQPGIGNVKNIWKLLNIPQGKKLLMYAWLLESYRCDTPFPILEIIGQQGTAKSNTQQYLRLFIDPNRVDLRSAPKNREDLFVGAQNSWLQCYNNLSHLPHDMQDAFCVMATGGGYATRTLYSNFDETAVETTRPIAMNGISALATAPDLLERLIPFELEPISDRIKESELKKYYEENKISIFTGILDLFAGTLAKLSDISLKNLPRMADFAHLGAALYCYAKKSEQDFLDDYNDMLTESLYRGLDGSPTATAILSYVEKHPEGINGTVGYVYSTMKQQIDRQRFPETTRGFADALRRSMPALKKAGIIVEFSGRRAKGYMLRITQNFGQGNVHNIHDVHGEGYEHG